MFYLKINPKKNTLEYIFTFNLFDVSEYFNKINISKIKNIFSETTTLKIY